MHRRTVLASVLTLVGLVGSWLGLTAPSSGVLLVGLLLLGGGAALWWWLLRSEGAHDGS
jgi:hypothetical protein